MIKFWFDKFDISRASHRLRVLLPVEYLKSQGYDSAIIGPSTINSIKKEDAVIFSKDSSLDNMRLLKSKGITVGFDLCDNKFQENGDLYYSFCKEVDFITVNSEKMAEVVLKETGRSSYYFSDCVERDIVLPVVDTHNPLRLLWFGGSSSIGYMDWKMVVETMDRLNIDYTLRVCSNKLERFKEKINVRYRKRTPESFNPAKLEFYNWSYDLQGELLEWCDIITIPVKLEFDPESKKGTRRIITKSHNRLCDGIASGKWVISTKLPSYMPLKDYCWLDNFADGVKMFINNKETVEQKIINGQKWITENASKEVIAKQIIDIYTKVKSHE